MFRKSLKHLSIFTPESVTFYLLNNSNDNTHIERS